MIRFPVGSPARLRLTYVPSDAKASSAVNTIATIQPVFFERM